MSDRETIINHEGQAGLICLNRPEALNALTLLMVHEIDIALGQFAADEEIAAVFLEGAGDRALCAGGDIRALYNSAKEKGRLGEQFWRDEYRLNFRIASYPKPYIAWMDGLVIGGGIGLSAHGNIRIVTDRTRLAIPETSLGFFPDVGQTFLLSRSPGELGTYFGLTGAPMNAADAILAGLADLHVSASSRDAVRAAVTELPINCSTEYAIESLKNFVIPAAEAPVARHRALIDTLFAHNTIEEIEQALASSAEPFAAETLALMRTKSPRGLKVTLALLRNAREIKSLKETLEAEYVAALKVFASEDFVEGIRAAVIEKDRKPRWSPPKLQDVTAEILASYSQGENHSRLFRD